MQALKSEQILGTADRGEPLPPRGLGCGKRAHATRQAAEQERAVLERQDKLARTRHKVNVYFCPCCNAWHTGRGNFVGRSRSGRRRL